MNIMLFSVWAVALGKALTERRRLEYDMLNAELELREYPEDPSVLYYLDQLESHLQALDKRINCMLSDELTNGARCHA